MTVDVRGYEVSTHSTHVFGRVLCTARDQHFVIDGPVQNGCPGEAVTPVEAFLAGLGACAVELVQVLARQEGVDMQTVACEVRGTLDRSKPLHPDHTLFQSIGLHFALGGVDAKRAESLVKAFKAR